MSFPDLWDDIMDSQTQENKRQKLEDSFVEVTVKLELGDGIVEINQGDGFGTGMAHGLVSNFILYGVARRTTHKIYMNWKHTGITCEDWELVAKVIDSFNSDVLRICRWERCRDVANNKNALRSFELAFERMSPVYDHLQVFISPLRYVPNRCFLAKRITSNDALDLENGAVIPRWPHKNFNLTTLVTFDVVSIALHQARLMESASEAVKTLLSLCNVEGDLIHGDFYSAMLFWRLMETEKIFPTFEFDNQSVSWTAKITEKSLQLKLTYRDVLSDQTYSFYLRTFERYLP